MTGREIDTDYLDNLSKAINDLGYKSTVVKLKSGLYSICIMVTRSEYQARECKQTIEKMFNTKVGIAVYHGV
jgi:hypothetical protein